VSNATGHRLFRPLGQSALGQRLKPPGAPAEQPLPVARALTRRLGHSAGPGPRGRRPRVQRYPCHDPQVPVCLGHPLHRRPRPSGREHRRGRPLRRRDAVLHHGCQSRRTGGTSLALPTPAAMRSGRAEARDITVLLDGQRILEHPGAVRAMHQGWNQELRHLLSGARFRFVVAPLMAGRRQPPSGTGDCP
jgi:hypothetical protein